MSGHDELDRELTAMSDAELATLAEETEEDIAASLKFAGRVRRALRQRRERAERRGTLTVVQ